MTTRFDTQQDLDRAVLALAERDPRLAPVIAVAGLPPLRRRPAGFEGLAAIVCGQQLSATAAAAIWRRVCEAYECFDADRARRARAERLRRLGLSAAKVETLKGVAREIGAARLDLAALADAPADEAHARLTTLRGIGPWTADIYLLFCLGHGDAWPAGDLAVQEAMRLGLGLARRPTVREMAGLAEPWRPLRGAAAHLWWAYYHAVKQRDARPAAAG